MIGIAPWRKRLDLAVDVLEELRRDDPRFTLFVKSKLPWELPWIWQTAPRSGSSTRRCSAGSAAPATGALGVVFDPAGRDVAVLAAPRRLRAVHQRRRELPPGTRRGHGVRARCPRCWPGRARTRSTTAAGSTRPVRDGRDIAAMVAEGRWEEERARGTRRGTRGPTPSISSPNGGPSWSRPPGTPQRHERPRHIRLQRPVHELADGRGAQQRREHRAGAAAIGRPESCAGTAVVPAHVLHSLVTKPWSR